MDFGGGDGGADGVFGVGNEDHAGGLVDGGEEGVDVVLPVAEGDAADLGAHGHGAHFVADEGVLGDYDAGAGFEEGGGHEGDDFVGSAAEEELFGGDVEFFGEFEAEVVAVAFGV